MGNLCPSLLGVTVVQWLPPDGSTSSCCSVSGAKSLMVASLPPSFSESSSDSAELDSSSDSSLFPNKTLSGLGERSKEPLLVVSLDSIGSSGKGSVFFLRSFRLSCLRAYEGLLLFPCEGPDFSLFSENFPPKRQTFSQIAFHHHSGPPSPSPPAC